MSKTSTAFFYALYLSLYATLWATFHYGVNSYMDRFQNIMTGVYIATNCLLIFLVICTTIVTQALKQGDSKMLNSLREKLGFDAAAVDKVTADRKSIVKTAYRFLAFYPAIICAGILLGYYHLFVAMAIDAILSQVLYSHLNEVSTILKGAPNGQEQTKSQGPRKPAF